MCCIVLSADTNLLTIHYTVCYRKPIIITISPRILKENEIQYFENISNEYSVVHHQLA